MDFLKSLWAWIKKYSFIFTKFISRKLASWVERHENQNQPEKTKELTFAEKKVRDVMLPYKNIKWVEAGEPITPAIMDELHKTGQQRFVLVKKANAAKPDIVGTLYIGDVLKHLDESIKLRSLMRPGAEYIQATHSLEQALARCLETGALLLVVTDGHGIVGQISIEQILTAAIGRLPDES